MMTSLLLFFFRYDNKHIITLSLALLMSLERACFAGIIPLYRVSPPQHISPANPCRSADSSLLLPRG